MDFGDISDNLPIIISIVMLILLQFFLRRKRSPEATNLGMVQGLLSEVRLNLRLTDIFTYSKPGRKFMTTSWTLYQNKLDFLDQSLRGTISDTFLMIEEYNLQIASAKKYKSTSYLAAMDMDRLKDLLTGTEEGLEKWLSSHSEMEDATPKTPGIFGGFTGRG